MKKNKLVEELLARGERSLGLCVWRGIRKRKRRRKGGGLVRLAWGKGEGVMNWRWFGFC